MHPDISKVVIVLIQSMCRWFTAGRVWDILYILANVGDLPLPEPSVRMSQKRTRSAEETAKLSPSNDIAPANEARQVAGTRRVQQYQQHTSSSSSSGSFSVPEHFDHPLPIHSDELGRLPLYPFFDTSMGARPNTTLPSYPQPVQGGPQWFPSSFSAMPGPSFQPASSQDTRGTGELDTASLEAIFNMLPPASYPPAEVPSAPVPQGAELPYIQNIAAMMNGNMGNMMPQTHTTGAQEPVAQNGFENGALAMWSDAPTGFECVAVPRLLLAYLP